ncbi:MAG: hypothetical protein FJW32_16505 [Acidobacteria bacterium]|nr:hypothetical protein [Acidobacteriota bacterium]
MTRPIAYHGSKFTIAYARDESGRFPGLEFFNQLTTSDKAKLYALFILAADHASTKNPEKFGNLGDGLFEFKSFHIRMPFAYAAAPERAVILISHGFIKKSQKAPAAEIERAGEFSRKTKRAAN